MKKEPANPLTLASMALFFDKEWFDTTLAARGLGRGDVAHALGLDEAQIAEIWKDQRELSARDVLTIAGLLGVAAAEVADRAGVSTPVPRDPSVEAVSLANAISDLAARVERVERTLLDVKALLLDLRRRP